MPERLLGQTLGKFRVDSLIGSGGFAWVYRAWDPELEIPVALKVLKPQYAGDEKFESRFRREASTAARLRHPNIVKIFAVGKENGAVYFAMDYLPQNLTDKLDVLTTLPEPVLVRMGIDVASALGFAHREGVVHRDIKVDNILFDEHGNAVVADFGIARALTNYVEQTGTNMVVGTPQYFSPEQARGQPLDGRADIYSLGVTLFRAATGQLPFNGDDWYEIARQQVEERPPKPRALNPELSRDVERIILRCLEKDPAERFPTGEQLCHALAAVLGDSGANTGGRTLVLPSLDLAGQATQLLPALGRRVRRVRAPFRVAAAGAAALLIVAPLIYVQRRGEAANPPEGESPAARPPRDGARTTPATVPGASAERTPGTSADEALPPARPPAFLVTFPEGAALTVDGTPVRTVGREWRSGPLEAGRTYSVVATLPSPVTCSWRSVQKRVPVQPGDTGLKVVRLTPRACGWVRITARNAPTGLVTYSLRPAKDGEPIAAPVSRGRLFGADSVSVPEGEYQLSLQAPLCGSYYGPVEVQAAKVSDQKVFMMCGKQ